uniref:JmjC domain-containing protein n=1 Tax=Alexandrium monilatum TaxID=311494 RepID=A0A7S4VKV0_9DINO
MAFFFCQGYRDFAVLGQWARLVRRPSKMHLISLERIRGSGNEEWSLTLAASADVLQASPDQPPAVHITTTTVHVKGAVGDASDAFDFPAECGPVADPAAVRCKFRRRRGQLVLSWPAACGVPPGASAKAEEPAAPVGGGPPGWPAELAPLVQLSDTLRLFCRSPSRTLWRQATRSWAASGELQSPFGEAFRHEDEGCAWLHVPLEDQDLADLPEAGPATPPEVAADAEFERWAAEASRGGRSAPSSLWLPAPRVQGAGAGAGLVGAQCDEVDARRLDAECIGRLLRYLLPASQRPVVLRGLAQAVFPAGTAWHFRHLERHIGCASVGSVRRSCGDGQEGGGAVFDYADEHLAAKCAEIGSPWADNSVGRLREEMSFREFLGRARAAGPEGCDRYFWATLFEHSQESGCLVGSELASLLESDVSQIQWSQLDAIAEAGSFGGACCAQLFCSGESALTSFHYDMVQNVFLHLRGAKRFVMLSPLLGAQALAPFPVGHPRDRGARLRLGEPGHASWPHAERARGGAVEAVLGPGDGLFLPLGWWHAVKSLERENISLNFWFRGGAVCARPRSGADPPRPLPEAAQLELLRAAERFLTRALGYRDLLPFLEWLQRPKALLTRESPPAGQEMLWLQCANFVLFSAARLVPAGALAGWLRALDVRRFLGL